MDTTTTSSNASNGNDRASIAGKYLTFFLAGTEYGVEVLKVHEILGMLPITSVPRTPGFVRGVVNLRGQVIPVIDLRRQFAMEPVEDNETTCIIVIRSAGLLIGAVVDAVCEVLAIGPEDVVPMIPLGADIDTAFIRAFGKCEGRVRILLDIDRVMTVGRVAAAEGRA